MALSFGRKKTTVGLDIGSGLIKVAVIDHSKKDRPELTRVSIAPLAAENPAIVDHCIAGHCSAEPGHKRLLALLGLDPLLSLDMRLGEGSGAAVAANIVRSALAAHDRMATFAEAAGSASL